jgi:hypothetical protein
MIQAPDGQLNLELTKFHQPVDQGSDRHTLPNAPGLRHIAFQIEDIDGIVERLTWRNARRQRFWAQAVTSDRV